MEYQTRVYQQHFRMQCTSQGGLASIIYEQTPYALFKIPQEIGITSPDGWPAYTVNLRSLYQQKLLGIALSVYFAVQTQPGE